MNLIFAYFLKFSALLALVFLSGCNMLGSAIIVKSPQQPGWQTVEPAPQATEAANA